MDEIFWFIATVWILLLALSRRRGEEIMGTVAGIVGIFFGLMIFGEITYWLGLIIIFFNFYVTYKALMGD